MERIRLLLEEGEQECEQLSRELEKWETLLKQKEDLEHKHSIFLLQEEEPAIVEEEEVSEGRKDHLRQQVKHDREKDRQPLQEIWVIPQLKNDDKEKEQRHEQDEQQCREEHSRKYRQQEQEAKSEEQQKLWEEEEQEETWNKCYILGEQRGGQHDDNENYSNDYKDGIENAKKEELLFEKEASLREQRFVKYLQEQEQEEERMRLEEEGEERRRLEAKWKPVEEQKRRIAAEAETKRKQLSERMRKYKKRLQIHKAERSYVVDRLLANEGRHESNNNKNNTKGRELFNEEDEYWWGLRHEQIENVCVYLGETVINELYSDENEKEDKRIETKRLAKRKERYYETRFLLAFQWWNCFQQPTKENMLIRIRENNNNINHNSDGIRTLYPEDIELLPWVQDNARVDIQQILDKGPTLDQKVMDTVDRLMQL